MFESNNNPAEQLLLIYSQLRSIHNVTAVYFWLKAELPNLLSQIK